MEATSVQTKAEAERSKDGATPRYITINLNKAIAIVTTAVLGAFVTGVAGALYTANSDHFRLISVDGRVAAVEQTYVRQDVLTAQFNALQAQMSAHIQQMTGIEKSVDAINKKLDR